MGGTISIKAHMLKCVEKIAFAKNGSEGMGLGS